jgi:hypothetical protein
LQVLQSYASGALHPTGGLQRRATRSCAAGYMGYYLGEIFFDNCVDMNGAPRMRTPSRRSGARSCHAPGGWLHEVRRWACCGLHGAPAGRVPVLGRFFIIAVHRAFDLGLVARLRGIVELSEGS